MIGEENARKIRNDTEQKCNEEQVVIRYIDLISQMKR